MLDFWGMDSTMPTSSALNQQREKLKPDAFGAFCDIVDRHVVLDGRKNVDIVDRGYCSYNNMAHIIEQNQYFLLRTKDIHSKGLVANFDFPEGGSFDIDVKVTLVRSHPKKLSVDSNTYKRFID